MRIAIFPDDLKTQDSVTETKHVFLFDIINNVVVSVGDDQISVSDMNYFLLWVIYKKVDAVYINDVPQKLRNITGQIYIHFKSLNELDPILKRILERKMKS